nr:hypothetical protein [uncultured organism]
MTFDTEKPPAFTIGFAGLGALLTTAGTARIIAHLQPADAFIGSICGGSADASASMFANAAHCWGCPGAALGVGLLFAAIIAAVQRQAAPPALRPAG